MKDDSSKNNLSSISFLQGGKATDSQHLIEDIKQKLAELSNVKNISFLLGAGTSANSIPCMSEMYKEITEEVEHAPSETLNSKCKELFESVSKNNLEELLNVLYAKKTYVQGVSSSEKDEEKNIGLLIQFIQKQMFSKININLDDRKYKETLNVYKKFYQKTALRNKDLSRVCIFTTNNDLFNEKALDNLNINYNNGFGGGLERVFNPARFRYTFSKKIDANLEKFEPLENMVYLYKLHGSISWIEEEGNSFFNIKEISTIGENPNKNNQPILIYPTPLKQSQSLGSPYSDLIREFQTKISLPNSVVFIIGYSFSDEHLNNIIYQALASNSSISIVIFGEHKTCPLTKIHDNRIYQIFGKDEDNQIHYFDYIVNTLLPDLDENKEKILVDDFVSALKKVKKPDGEK